MTTPAGTGGPDAPLPGAVGISRLTVYDTPTPDARRGGSAHVHLACSEGYVVLSGHGSVQTLGARGFQEVPLYPGRVVWFAPGIIHRLVNDDGALEILTVMQNGGLPEAGDAVLTFPPEVLADGDRYRAAAAVPPRAEDPAPAGDGEGRSGLEAAYTRRDLAIQGFRQLREAYDCDGPAALQPFYRAAAALAQPKLAAWRELWTATALKQAHETGTQLDALARGDLAYLEGAALHDLPGPVEEARLGMCGYLGTYPAGQPQTPFLGDPTAGDPAMGDPAHRR